MSQRNKAMIFFIGMLILVLAAIAVVYKTLTGYTDFAWYSKFGILFFLIISWFSPVWLKLIRHGPEFLNGSFYTFAYQAAYFLMGFVLILSMLLIARDIIWQILYLLAKRSVFNPDNAHHINILNVITIIAALFISVYGVFEAHMSPIAKELTISDSRIKKPIKFVIASDFHIDQSTSKAHISKMIKAINAQNPDYILLVGDIIDDKPEFALEKFKLLKDLKAKKIYVSLGNHEYYNRPYAWIIEFSKLGFEVLHNSGEMIDESGIYLAGVPDVGSVSANYERAFAGSDDQAYKILLSHSPTDFKDMDKSAIDLQLSGHTHGGQIFPFQYITKKANDGYLAGLYQEDGTKLYVMKGAGYWGPPIRLMAKPDILVLNLESEK